MRKTSSFQFGLPRFQGAVRTIILLTLGIWITLVLLSAFDRLAASYIVAIGELNPAAVLHGWVWQLLTYGFLHVDPWYALFTLMAVYFIGSAVQDRVGSRAFAELYVITSILAGMAGVLLSLTGRIGAGTVLGAGAAANGVLMIFYMFYRGSSIFLFPFPFQIPVKWVVIGIGGIEGAYFLLSGFRLFYLVELLGLGAGYVWYRFFWRGAGVSAIFQGRVSGFRNGYYRWKRRRAARKFEVYMRKHEDDPKKYFDEYGNFKPPGEKDKSDRGPGGWVN